MFSLNEVEPVFKESGCFLNCGVDHYEDKNILGSTSGRDTGEIDVSSGKTIPQRLFNHYSINDTDIIWANR